MSKIETVVNMSLSRTNKGVVLLSIEDEHSGDRILDIDMSLEELSLLITGFGGVKGAAKFFSGSNIAKKREVKSVTCDKTPSFSKQDQKELVQEHFENNIVPLNEGWVIHDDGTRSQQNSKDHRYILKRYVPVEDVYDVERYY